MSSLYEMTPKEIVGELDKYIIGQERAKKSVAVALRNRYKKSTKAHASTSAVRALPLTASRPSMTSPTRLCPHLKVRAQSPW